MRGAPAEVTVPLAREALARAGALWVREASLSMQPLIQPGDELELAPLRAHAIHRGTLIAYERDSQLVVHRVVSCGSAGVVAKGDALWFADPLVRWDQVVGRIVGLRRASGQPVDLEAFPWPLLNRVLGALAALASRLSLGSPPLLGRLLWKALRLPFYVVALVRR